MSHEASNWAFNVKVGDGRRKLVLVGLANHAHKDGRNSWISKGSLADYAECSSKTVGRHLARLVLDGWIRRGDQRTVAHLRPDRRPVVYDLAMTEATRSRWAEAEAAGDSSWDSEQRGDAWWLVDVDEEPRGDSLSPRGDEGLSSADDQRGDKLSPRAGGHGGTHGGTPVSERGDTAVSPEPLGTQEHPPSPPPSGGSIATSPCPRHLAGPQANCRSCGTTPRQLEEQRRRDQAAEKRAHDQAALRAERLARQARRNDPDLIADIGARVRQQIADTRGAAAS